MNNNNSNVRITVHGYAKLGFIFYAGVIKAAVDLVSQ